MNKEKIKKRKVSIILFYDNNGNILIQNRKEISKHGEEYGFLEVILKGEKRQNKH